MKRAMALVLLWFTGCMSMTETQVVFIKMSPPQGMKFFVSAFELSDSVQALPLGKKPASFDLSEKLRACLVKHQGELFSAHPNGALPIKVSINVKPNRSSRLASNGRFGPEICSRGYWDSGWQSITMMMHHKVWSLIYEVRCRYDDGGRAQKVARIVNVDGATTEPPFLFAPIMLPFLCLVDNLYFNGFGLFPGMVDDYDWLMEKEFADVMASAVAEFDVDASKADVRKAAETD